MKKLILIGAGGHAKSVADSINKSEYELCGFIDSNKKGMHMGLPILGTGLEDIPNCEKYSYFVSIGDVGYRKLWFDRIRERRLNIINIIDSSAIISASAKMGIGNFVGKMAVINADVEIGNKNEKYQDTRSNRKQIFPFVNIKKGIETAKDELNKRSLQGISYGVGYLMRCIGIIFASIYYIQFLVKVGYNAPFERDNINYMPMGRYENVA